MCLSNARELVYHLAVLPTNLRTLGIDCKAPAESLTPLPTVICILWVFAASPLASVVR